MNILFVLGKYPNYGGVETVTTVLSNRFISLGYSVSIVSFEQPIPELINNLNNSVKLFKLEYPVNSSSNIKTLRKILINQKIDFIINQWALPFYVTKLCNNARKGLNCKLIQVLHNTPNSNARIVGIKIRIENTTNIIIKSALNIILYLVNKITAASISYVYSHSDRYIVLSKSYHSIFKEITGNKNLCKLHTITNPITVDLENNNYYTQKELEVIYVGRLDYNQKRVFRVIDVWRKVEPIYPKWKLTIVGDGPEKDSIVKLINTYKLQNVYIVGFKSPIEYYKRASILIQTSEYEGLPLVLGEAMHYGVVPIVYGSFDSVYDIIDSGKNGEIIVPNPKFDCNKMAEKMSKLMADSSKLRQYSTEAKLKSELFNIATIDKEWIKLFNEITHYD